MVKSEIIELDVRPILKSGIDPFEKIMESLDAMTNNQTLKLINSFEPIPLLNILKDKGYSYVTTRPENGVVHTTIERNKKSTKVDVLVQEDTIIPMTFEQVEKKFSGKLNEVDVRDLEMPLPMVTILEEIEKIDNSKALFVHHKRLPQYLLPELEERGYSYVHNKIDDNNIKLIIYK